ncbi:hypothetical protein MFMK1_001311 [Metallumcola ferriviriculae]|uniref:Transcriptional regulator n=1 Tax=Metallumcola ferriviriculae TaxID=3039180 RepID=A0AAU0UMT6_9FIRM|nr:hypothetical protein MFMK1_001311 [Desulfitibacteraceae bacterium MK1]
MTKTKNDIAWAKLFDKYNILPHVKKHEYFEITAAQINEFREARLMTKFDHKSNLPQMFEQNGLSILPVTRGSYIISNLKAYHKFENVKPEVKTIIFPDYIETIDYENITSESAAISCAYITGILGNFIEDEEILPTVFGRMSSGQFNFNIQNVAQGTNFTVNVQNSQIEIDAGYESLRYFTLIEAKNSLSDDFLVRQIYYPFRCWQSKIRKDIKNVYLTYSNGIFSLYEYQFREPSHYNSLFLVRQKNYTIDKGNIELEDIKEILRTVQIVEEPRLQFPQANSFLRLINLCELLHESEVLTRDEITTMYDFANRQTNYYTDAARYLGLVDKAKNNDGEIIYFLTDEGRDLFKLSLRARQLEFVRIILSYRVFNETLKLYLRAGIVPADEVVTIMKQSNLYNINSNDTFYRRASTVKKWIEWIIELTL